MYICICKAVTDTQIKNAVDEGAQCLRDISTQLDGACQQCGKCAKQAKSVITERLQETKSSVVG